MRYPPPPPQTAPVAFCGPGKSSKQVASEPNRSGPVCSRDGELLLGSQANCGTY